MRDDLHTTRWRKLRERVLRRDGYRCQVSARFGKLTPADTVHHVFPRDEFPEYAWEPWNLISVSSEVHNRLHSRSTDELTEEGVQLLRRIAMRWGVPVPLRYRSPPHPQQK